MIGLCILTIRRGLPPRQPACQKKLFWPFRREDGEASFVNNGSPVNLHHRDNNAELPRNSTSPGGQPILELESRFLLIIPGPDPA